MTLDRSQASPRPWARIAASSSAIIVVAALAVGWASGRHTGAVSGGSQPAAASASNPESAAQALAGYPPPAPSTATPAANGAGVFPPPLLNHRIIGRDSSPYRQLINSLDSALASRSGAAFAPWVDTTRSGLALEYPGATEGFGIRLNPSTASNLLDVLFGNGSAPVVQGYFEKPGCTGIEAGGPCWPIFLTSGWQGPVAMPTKDPSETLGPATPENLPVGAAAWEMFPDPTGPYWTAWWLGDGYHLLLERLVAEGHGTYFVLR